MSKVKLYPILVILTLLAQPGLLLAHETPDSNEGEIMSLSEGAYTDFVETTYDDPDWVLVTSDLILRANICVASDPVYPYSWYEEVFNPCYPDEDRYWKIAPGLVTGRAFPMGELSPGGSYTLDSFYVPEGFGFQLYDGTTGEPCSPYFGGARYVSLDHSIERIIHSTQ
jgi:hypothetical protein